MSLVGAPTLDASPPAVAGKHGAPAPLVAVAAAVAAGIVLDRVQSDWLVSGGQQAAGYATWWLIAAIALAVWFTSYRHQRDAAASWALLAGCACLAAGWHHWCWNQFPADELGRFATDNSYPCCVEAVALSAPERIAAPPPSPFRAIPVTEKSQLPLRITRLRQGEHWQAASGRCDLIVNGHLLEVAAGDRLLVFCQIRQPSPARNPGQFDFAKHARADRQLVMLRSHAPECVTVIESARGWRPWSSIDRLRTAWRERLWSTLGPDRAPMAAAILLGSRGALSDEQTLPFKISGAMHVLVVSGLHAGILVALLFIALGMGLLPRSWALAVAMVLVAGYAMLTGAYPPVVRAAVLAELACLAMLLGRNPLAINSLAAAAIVVLALNPADLFRTGPQLSFLCTLMLLWFSSVQWRRARSPLEILLHNVRPWQMRAALHCANWLGIVMAATLAVWIISLPLLMHQYHLVSPVAVLASPLVFGAVMIALVSGFLFLIGGWLLPFIASPLASLCEWSVGALDGVVNRSTQIPAAYIWSPAPSTWWVLGWYTLAVIALRAGGTTWGPRRTIQLAAVWTLIGAAPVALQQFQTQSLEVTFLDVGHGAAVVAHTPTGGTLIYDAGSIGSPDYASDAIAGYLWSRGVRSIDGVVLSHDDVDHFNAMPGLLERFRIGRVFVSPMMFPRRLSDDDHSAAAELRRLLDAHGVEVRIIQLGDRLTLDETTHADVLYPDRLGNFGGDNANSLVLAIESGVHRVLLPGDLESPGIEDVMAEVPYDCGVLLAPHHGSRRSDPPGFAAWSTPEWVVVSGGGDLGGDDVAASYRHRGAQVLATHERGAIRFVLAPNSITVHPFLDDSHP